MANSAGSADRFYDPPRAPPAQSPPRGAARPSPQRERIPAPPCVTAARHLPRLHVTHQRAGVALDPLGQPRPHPSRPPRRQRGDDDLVELGGAVDLQHRAQGIRISGERAHLEAELAHVRSHLLDRSAPSQAPSHRDDEREGHWALPRSRPHRLFQIGGERRAVGDDKDVQLSRQSVLLALVVIVVGQAFPDPATTGCPRQGVSPWPRGQMRPCSHVPNTTCADGQHGAPGEPA